jgi:hypothetical protein
MRFFLMEIHSFFGAIRARNSIPLLMRLSNVLPLGMAGVLDCADAGRNLHPSLLAVA